MGYFWVDLPTTESGVGDSAVIYSTVDCILTTSAHETVQNVSLRKYRCPYFHTQFTYDNTISHDVTKFCRTPYCGRLILGLNLPHSRSQAFRTTTDTLWCSITLWVPSFSQSIPQVGYRAKFGCSMLNRIDVRKSPKNLGALGPHPLVFTTWLTR